MNLFSTLSSNHSDADTAVMPDLVDPEDEWAQLSDEVSVEEHDVIMMDCIMPELQETLPELPAALPKSQTKRQQPRHRSPDHRRRQLERRVVVAISAMANHHSS